MLAAEPAALRRDQLETHVLAEELPHLATEIRQAVDQAKLERLLARPELAGEQTVARRLDLLAAARLDESDELGMHVGWMDLIRSTSSGFSGKNGSSMSLLAPAV